MAGLADALRIEMMEASRGVAQALEGNAATYQRADQIAVTRAEAVDQHREQQSPEPDLER